MRSAGQFGIRFLTIYSFSTENWSRPRQEVNDLMSLIKRFVREDLAELHRAGVKVMMIGDRNGLDSEIVRLVGEAENLTRENDQLTLVVAFNYGGREEITRAVRGLAGDVVAGKVDPQAIDAAGLDQGAIELNVAGTEPDERSCAPSAALKTPSKPDNFDDYAALTGWEPGE